AAGRGAGLMHAGAAAAAAAPTGGQPCGEPPPALGVVEADADFAAGLRASFGELGFPCEAHRTVDALVEGWAGMPSPRLVLLGGGDPAAPLSALRRLRDASRVPCILLVGGLDEAIGALARNAGADDAADRAAPFAAILARVRAVLRRAEWGTADAMAAPPEAALDGWRLLPDRRQLLLPDGRECPLTTAEFDLVRVLVERRGRAVSRDAIARSVFGRPFRPDDRTVDNLVLRLRRKLEAADPRAIKTVRGAGYMFAGFGAAAAGAGGRAGRSAATPAHPPQLGP
ncbi:winged helix-turn-helix transcriptional regulator, partial [Craurococcus roseus]|uniref:winged helix-turn-helix transcriptional regulator n=1 Tax=Craurococcus roseus TaxID=77585 RepID=UPI0031E3FE38